MIQIPLRAKYKTGRRSKYKGAEHAARVRKRRKIGSAVHAERQGAPIPRTRVVEGKTGKSVMKEAPKP